jgi:hypothetical protein
MHCAETIYWAYDKPFRTQGDAMDHARACRLVEQDRARREAEEKHLEQVRLSQRTEEIASQRRQRIIERSQRRAKRLQRWDAFYERWQQSWLSRPMRARALAESLRRVFFCIAFAVWFVAIIVCACVVALCLYWAVPVPPRTPSTQNPTLLTRITELSPLYATFLVDHNSDLHLDGLKSLTPEVATILAGTQGKLKLNGLKSLTPEVARALVKHSSSYGCSLELNGLKSLTPEVATILVGHHGPVELNGMKALTPELKKKKKATRIY